MGGSEENETVAMGRSTDHFACDGSRSGGGEGEEQNEDGDVQSEMRLDQPGSQQMISNGGSNVEETELSNPGRATKRRKVEGFYTCRRCGR